MDENQTVIITVKEYDQLLKDSHKLIALQGAGVDAWEGYDLAMEYLDDEGYLIGD